MRAVMLLALLTVAPAVAAQTPPAAQPAPYPYPPPYPYPYPPPPGYGYPPPPQQAPVKEAPRELKYVEGQSTPAGYRYEERPRQGLIIAGSLTLGIPYAFGVLGASAAGFENQSGWLLVPAVGPFLTLALREGSCDEDTETSDQEAAECVGDVFLTMALVLDALAQTAGGVLLLLGVSSSKKVWVREDVSVRVAPTQVGSGWGFGAFATF